MLAWGENLLCPSSWWNARSIKINVLIKKDKDTINYINAYYFSGHLSQYNKARIRKLKQESWGKAIKLLSLNDWLHIVKVKEKSQEKTIKTNKRAE